MSAGWRGAGPSGAGGAAGEDSTAVLQYPVQCTAAHTFCTVLSTHSVLQGAMLLVSSGQVATLEQGEARIREVLDTGAALDKFRMMILRQVWEELGQSSDGHFRQALLFSDLISDLGREWSQVWRISSATRTSTTTRRRG